MTISNQAFYGSKLVPLSSAKSAEGIKSRPTYERLKDKAFQEINEEDLFTDEERQAWDDRKEKWEVYFAEIEGWKRKYTVERPPEYGGNMLDAEHTGNPEDKMVIAILEGISDEDLKEVESSEDIYEKSAVDSEEIEFYGERPEEMPDQVMIYSGGDHEAFNEDTDEFRSKVYHLRILNGLDRMADEEIIEEETAEKVKQNYRENTGERWALTEKMSPETEEINKGKIWNNVRRNEEIEGIAEMHGQSL